LQLKSIFLNEKIRNKIKKITHVYVDLVKIGVTAKIATESKLKGPEKSCFFRGSKSQL